MQRTNPYDNEAARFNLARLSSDRLRAEARSVMEKPQPSEDDRDWLAVVKAELDWRATYGARR